MKVFGLVLIVSGGLLMFWALRPNPSSG